MSDKEETSSQNSLHGMPWSVDSNHNTFESADKKRNELSTDSQQVKVRRRSDGTFSVKVRSTKIEEKKSKKKSKKSKKKKAVETT